MPIIDCIIALFVYVDDQMKDIPCHSQEILCPSELVTIGLLYALKGVGQSAFYRWLFHNYRHLFPGLPDRTRLFRRLAARQDWTDRFLAEDSLLGIADSYGIELVHPRRHGRAENSEAAKGLSNQRWIAGIKVCAIINHLGRVTDWRWAGANLHDKHFRPLIASHPDSAVLTDGGFHGNTHVPWVPGDPDNLNVCKKGQCNARFLIETVFSLWTGFFSLKEITERATFHIQSHLAFAIAAFNCVQAIFASQPDENGRIPLTMAGICL